MEPDQTVAGYRLRNLLAAGQSSEVWEVVEQSSSRHLAMKTLLSSASKDAEQRRMLLHEADVGLKLAHPNIIRILNVSKDPKQTFFVMEFFPAGSMKVRIVNKQTEFIKGHAHTIFKQIATALAYMNASDWIHRDVKPDNMLVNTMGESKLIDFAISIRPKKKRGLWNKLFGGKQKAQGTRSYMSPEQIRGEPLDARADVYSFGASVYEIITLRPPFRGASSQDLLTKHLHEKPLTPQGHNPEVTDDFSKLVLDMLAKKKDDRPHNFHEVLMRMKNLAVFKGQKVGSQR